MAARASSGSLRKDWGRQYPPLIVLAAAILLAALSLPSALVLPEASPSQTLEYAPVPPNGAAPPGGNLASLGLGTSATLGSNDFGGLSLGPPAGGTGTNPSNKHCVGNPPRQTEDPLSPPCVAYFAGSNGGTTYAHGVSGSEVRILYYIACNGSSDLASDGSESPPCDTYYDFGKAPTGPEPVIAHSLRAYQAYFNDRYQTYGRRVHFYAFWSSEDSSGNAPPSLRRQDAADNMRRVDPFAVMAIDYDAQGDLSPYLDAMAQSGALVFGTLYDEPASYYQQYAPRIWSYQPTAEQAAEQYSSYVCTKVLRHAVSFSGNPAYQNGPRRLGIVYSGDPNTPELQRLAGLVQSDIQHCGGQFVDSYAFPSTGGCNPYAANAASGPMARFSKENITTVIWPQGFDLGSPSAAAAIGYEPEWIMAGGADFDDYGAMKCWPASEAEHAVDVTNGTLVGLYTDEYCGQAVLEAEPNFPQGDLFWACRVYPSLRQLFIGLQVAGPNLNPARIDQGFHAIPAHASSDPQVPACFYDRDDYACVKDMQMMWWDPTGRPPSSSQAAGCWRAMLGGSRFLTDQWPSGDVMAQRDPAHDPCDNFYTGAYPTDPTTPA